MNGGMKHSDTPLNTSIQQEWNTFNKRGQQIKNIIKKREKKQIKYVKKNYGITTK